MHRFSKSFAIFADGSMPCGWIGELDLIRRFGTWFGERGLLNSALVTPDVLQITSFGTRITSRAVSQKLVFAELMLRR